MVTGGWYVRGNPHPGEESDIHCLVTEGEGIGLSGTYLFASYLKERENKSFLFCFGKHPCDNRMLYVWEVTL